MCINNKMNPISWWGGGGKGILFDRNAAVETDWSWSSDGRKTVIETDGESNVIFWILMWKMKWMGDGMLSAISITELMKARLMSPDRHICSS